MKVIERLMFYYLLTLLADSRENPRDLESEFERVCQGKELNINPSKSKVMKISVKLKEDQSELKNLKVDGVNLIKVYLQLAILSLETIEWVLKV